MIDEIPQAVRFPNEEHLYKSATNDPLIQPDLVAPAVEGYFRIPAIWIGSKPEDSQIRRLDFSVHHQVIQMKKLASGIEVWVLRCGIFLFDFSNYV